MLLVGLLTVFPVRAGADNREHRCVDIHDGLTSMFVLSLHQDAEGFIWAGTYNGLSILAGNNSEVLTQHVPLSRMLAGSIIENIQSTDDGAMWVQTNFGMYLWDRRTNKLAHYPEAQGGNRCAVSPEGDVVVFTSRRGFLYYNKKVNAFKPLAMDSLQYLDCRSMCFDEEGRLTLYMYSERLDYELTTADDGTVTATLLQREPYFCGSVHYAHPSGSDFFYIDDAYRVHIADAEGHNAHYCFTMSDAMREHGNVSAIVRDGQDILISFKTSGIVHMSYQTDGTYVEQPQQVTCGVFDMMKDSRQDILWVATDGEGIIYRVRNPHLIRNEMFDDLPFVVSKPVRALLRDGNGDLWVGTKGAGLLYYAHYQPFDNASREVRQFTRQNSPLLHNSVYSLECGSHGIVWICTDANGLNYYDTATRRLGVLAIDDRSFFQAHDLVEVDGQTLYVATGRGAFSIQLAWQGNVPVATDVQRLIFDTQNDYTNFASVSRQGNQLWFACRNTGIVRYDFSSRRYAICRFSDERLTAINDAICVDASRPGVIYCGTSAGAFQLQAPFDRKLQSFLNLAGVMDLQGNVVRSLVATPHDTLWASTSNALFCLDTRTRSYELYTAANGLSALEFGEGACFYDTASGTAYFGATNGFMAIAPRKRLDKSFMPPVVFYGVRVGDQTYSLRSLTAEGKPLKLRYNQNYFTLGFTAVDYADANDYAFEYRINGQAWVDNGTRRIIPFIDVDPGDYHLEVRYKKGSRQSTSYALDLQVMPPWWTSRLALAAYYLIGLLAAALIIHAFMQHQHRRRRLEAEETEKRHREEIYASRLRFFIDLTHEFSTPLMLIEGPVKRILAESGLSANVRHYASVIQSSSRQMNDLIQRVIKYRSYESGHLLPQETESKDVAIPSPPTRIDAKKPTAFIADVSHEVLALLEELLRPDFNVFCFDDAGALMKKVATLHPDIIIAETVMTPLGGLELCRLIKGDAATSHIPVILLSTDFDPQTRKESVNVGADSFLTKPFDLDYLQSLVRGLLQQRSQLKAYFNSSLSAFQFRDGRLLHEEDSAFMEKMVGIICENLSNPDLTAAFIADKMGIGLRNLYRRMQEFTDETPTTLVRELRLERAAQLLTKTEMSMEEVCYTSGFNNRGTFYKQFAAKYGCTPGKYHDLMIETVTQAQSTDDTHGS